METKSEYNMEFKGGNVAFPTQGGSHVYSNIVGFQDSYGTDDHVPNAVKGMQMKLYYIL